MANQRLQLQLTILVFQMLGDEDLDEIGEGTLDVGWILQLLWFGPLHLGLQVQDYSP